jgi:hypothetical protein
VLAVATQGDEEGDEQVEVGTEPVGEKFGRVQALETQILLTSICSRALPPVQRQAPLTEPGADRPADGTGASEDVVRVSEREGQDCGVRFPS